MIENIWSGWRSQYISNLVHDGRSLTGPSIFRQIIDSGLSDEESFIVHRRGSVFTIMNSFPYTVGHVLVVPMRQVADLTDLDSSETRDLWEEVHSAVRVVRSVLSPDGVNVGVNLGAASGGSVNEHLHVHVVPRWIGDANFLVSTALTKSIPEALDVTAARLRKAWREDENGAIQ